jgi:sarcosine oxidase subunit beta
MIEKVDVAILGGGIFGTSTAFYIARDTKLSVALFERTLIGSGSTGRSAGVVRHYYSTDLLIESAIASRKIFEDFKESVGEHLDYVKNGYLTIDSGEPVKSSWSRVAEMTKKGLDADILSASELTDRFPFVRMEDDEVAIIDKGAGFVVNPPDAARIYARQAEKHGAKIYEMTPVTGIGVRGGAVGSVKTPKGEIAASHVVNASGPWARQVGKMVGLDIPIEAERVLLLDLKPPEPWPLSRPTISDRKYYTYIKPAKNGIAHIGGHYYGQECDPSNYSDGADPEFIQDIIPKLTERCPELAKATISAGYAGPYENTADRYPLVGESEELKGFITIAGWSGHGFKHGPMFGMLMKELIETGSTSLDISILKPERFKAGKPVDTPYARVRAPYG